MTARLPRACIMMSLYRGTRFLDEQLASIARQQGVTVHVHARDDGSGDATAAMFEATCAALGLSATLERGDNIGAIRSFFALMWSAPASFDLYAFADQDDVWEKDKLARAAARLSSEGPPELVASGHVIVDSAMRETGRSVAPRRIGLGNALVENVVQGAACAMNRSALDLVRALGEPSDVVMHDWWLYLVMSALGRVIYDDAATLRYRQHDQNVVGAEASRVRAIVQRAGSHAKRPRLLHRQAEEFLDRAGARLSAIDRALVERFVTARGSVRRRAALAADRAIWRQRPVDDLIMRLLVALGRY